MNRIRFRLDDRTLMINNEQCAIITDFDKYAVSMSGNVYNIKTGRQLKPAKHYESKRKYNDQGKRVYVSYNEKYSYYNLFVILYDNTGKKCMNYVHRLVAREWLKETDFNPDGTPIVGIKCINHIDHDTANNKVTNLEWCDNKYNRNH